MRSESQGVSKDALCLIGASDQDVFRPRKLGVNDCVVLQPASWPGVRQLLREHHPDVELDLPPQSTFVFRVRDPWDEATGSAAGKARALDDFVCLTTPFGAAELVAKVVHVVPGNGVALAFVEADEASRNLAPLLDAARAAGPDVAAAPLSPQWGRPPEGERTGTRAVCRCRSSWAFAFRPCGTGGERVTRPAMDTERLGFWARLGVAMAMLWKVLVDAAWAAQARRLLRPVSAAPTPTPPPAAADPVTALQLLAIMQREGRLVDFLQEDMSAFSDAEIGAAARVVHEGCKRALSEYLVVEPLRREAEGDDVVLERGFDATRTRVTGNVVGEPPFRGRLAHHGWHVAQIRMPALAQGHNPRVLAPAEVELS